MLDKILALRAKALERIRRRIVAWLSGDFVSQKDHRDFQGVVYRQICQTIADAKTSDGLLELQTKTVFEALKGLQKIVSELSEVQTLMLQALEGEKPKGRGNHVNLPHNPIFGNRIRD